MTMRVYGRTEYADPLTELGTVDDDADVLAGFPGEGILAGFPGEWVELIAFPDGAIQWIIRDGAEVDGD